MAKQNNKIPVIYTKQIIIEGDNEPNIPFVSLSIKNNELSIKDRNDNSLFTVNKEGASSTIDLNNPIISNINNTLNGVASRFDNNGILKNDNIPTIASGKLDPSIITDIAIGKDGKTVADAAAAGVSSINERFDENNKLKDANLPTSILTEVNFTDRFNTAFDEKNPITTTNFGTNFDAAFVGKNPVTTGVEGNFDDLFDGKNPITTANFGVTFDAAFTGKNPVTTGVGGNFDDLFDGKNPVTTGVGGNFDNLFDGKVPTGYASWDALATNATNGNNAFSKFSGAGGKLPVDSVIPPGDYTGWGEINTDLARGISADDDLDNLDFSVDTTDPNNPIIKINKGGSRGFTTTTVGKSSIGLGNVANESPASIRAGIGLSVDSTTGQISITRSGTSTLTANPLSSTEFTNTKTNASDALTNAATAQNTADTANNTATTVRNFFGTEPTPQLKDTNTPAGLKNSNVSLTLSGQTFTFNNGSAQSIPISKTNVGLDQVQNQSPTTIRSGITVDANGILQGIGTSNIPVNVNKSRVNSLIASSNILLIGNTAKKTGGTSWNEQVYSKDGYSGGAYFSVTMDQTTFMVGLNTDPVTNANFSSIDYAWYAVGVDLYAFESGTNTQSFVNSLSSGDVLSITYDGDKIRYFHNGELKRTVTVAITAKLFFDSSFSSNNASFSNIQFGPMTSVAESLANAAAANTLANTAKTTADAANTLAGVANTLSTDIDSRFVDGILKVENAADALKNSNVTKASIGLPNVEDVSPTQIRAGITVDTNGILQGIGTANVAVKNDLVTKTSIGLGNVADESPATIRSGIGLSVNSTTGQISITRSGTTTVTGNPLTSTEFTSTKTNASNALSTANTVNGRFSVSGKLLSANLSDDNDSFKFTSSNKFKIGLGNAQINTSNTNTTQYDSDTDIEIVTGSVGIPDIAFLKAEAAGSRTLGQLNFKGWNGSNFVNTFGGTTLLKNYSERVTIRGRTAADSGGYLDFMTAEDGLRGLADAATIPATRMTISPNGNVGIDKTTPNARLHIKCGDHAYNGIRLEETDNTTYWDIYYGSVVTSPEPNNIIDDNLYFSKGSNYLLGGYLDDAVNVANIDFTGQHRSLPSSGSIESYIDKIGLIVVSDGQYTNFDGHNGININEALPKVILSNQRNQKSCFGVISDREDENSEGRVYHQGRWASLFEKSIEDNRLIINSLGEGGIWVTNINGNLENGDYITTCEIPGYGMKQDDDLLHNYTVAKITCDCNFDLQSPIYICEEFEWEGQAYRRAFVGCTYHCG